MELPPGLLSNAPQLETRRALLILDLQNDFVGTEGKLPIHNVPEFIPALAKLASRFREEGEVVWVQSEFDEPRPTLDPMTGSYSVLLKEFLPEDSASSVSSLDNYLESEGLTATLRSLAAPVREHSPAPPKSDPEAFLARGINKINRLCLPGQPGCHLVPELAAIVDRSRDVYLTKSQYGALTNNPLLLTLRVRMVTELYLCGSLSNIGVYATAVEAVTHGFKVTIVEDCVGYQEDRLHEEAMRQMADVMGAFGITSSELIDDLDGILSAEEEEEEAPVSSMLDVPFNTAAISTESLTLRPKVEDWIASVEQDGGVKNVEDQPKLEADGLTTIDVVEQTHESSPPSKEVAHSEPLGLRRPSSSPPRKRSISEVDFQRPDLTSKLTLSEQQKSHDLVDTKDCDQAADEVRARRRKSSKSEHIFPEKISAKLREKETAATQTPSVLESLQEPSSDMDSSKKTYGQGNPGSASIYSAKKRAGLLLGQKDSIGEGDCRIICDFIQEGEDESLFQSLRAEVQWQHMYHRTGPVPRLVAVQGSIEADGSIPIYRHPADESPPLLPFSKIVSRIRSEAEKAVGHPLNHALIQLYRNGEDSISEHSDKTLDIVRGSKIVNYSVGARRTMILRRKRISKDTGNLLPSSSEDQSTQPTPAAPRESQRLPLPHNSLFILGPKTNMVWLHSIRADKRIEKEKDEEELAYDQARISLTFRHVGTFLNPTEQTIWGQGATATDEKEAGPVLKGDEEAVEKMVQAFGQENHQGKEFDWEKWYGEGFDVVNFVTKERFEREVEIGTTK
ncbi:MAG: hypothetical protein Q9160_001503 [Pyrenula sp. 1 TL-2023]